MNEIEKLQKEIQAMRLSVQNHDETVKQNRDLQTELKNAKDKIKELESRPFFHYQMNDGGRKDYGEFYLISHA